MTGLNSDDISATSPVAKNEIKEHDDKDDKNVAGLSGMNNTLHTDDETEINNWWNALQWFC